MNWSCKRNNSKECIVWDYWYVIHRFKFQNSVCNGCHDLKMLYFNISNFGIIVVKGVYYGCLIHIIKEFGAIFSLKYFVLDNHGYIYNANQQN